jgi:hypothetical protein
LQPKFLFNQTVVALIMKGAVASSGPLLAQMDFKEYQEVFDQSIGSDCSGKFQVAVKQIGQFVQHPLGWRILNQTFNLCIPFDGSNQDNVNNFYASLLDAVDGVVQYSNDNVEFEVIVNLFITCVNL